MTPSNNPTFNRNFALLEKHLNLKGMRPRTKESYLRGVRQMGEYFTYDIVDLQEQQLLDYFNDLLDERSWSTRKHQLYGLKLFYKHVLNKPWEHVDLVAPPRATVMPDIVSVAEAMKLFNETRILSYKVFFFTLYILGLCLGEGIRLEVGDIDTAHRRVHVRDATKSRRLEAREAKTAWYHSQRRRCVYYGAFGRYTVIQPCCFLTENEACQEYRW